MKLDNVGHIQSVRRNLFDSPCSPSPHQCLRLSAITFNLGYISRSFFVDVYSQHQFLMYTISLDCFVLLIVIQQNISSVKLGFTGTTVNVTKGHTPSFLLSMHMENLSIVAFLLLNAGSPYLVLIP